MDHLVPAARNAGSVAGSPMTAGDFFFGLEDPQAVPAESHLSQPIGNWSGQDLRAGQTRRKSWSLPATNLVAGTNEIIFQYQGGRHRLDIARVLLLEDGRELAQDQHPGWTGRSS